MLRRDWRNTILHDRLQAQGQIAYLLPLAKPLYSIWDEHVDGGDHKTARLPTADCTHWCLGGLGFKIVTSAMLSALFGDIPEE